MTALLGAAIGRRILFVHQSSDLYGSDRVLLECADAVNRAGGEAVVALPGDGPLVSALRHRRIETHVLTPANVLKIDRRSLSAGGLARLMASVPGSIAALRRCADNGPLDLVCSSTLAVFGGAVCARLHDLPHVWHVHEIVDRPAIAARAFAMLLRLCADDVVCNSRATARFLAGLEPALGARTRVVWNGVPDPRRVPSPAAASYASKFRPNGERLAIGLVGRINRMKGHALLLEACERLEDMRSADFSIVFIGSPPPGQEEHLVRLREHIRSSPIGERVVLCDFIAETAAAYAALDLVCMPSTEAEGFGLVAVEAMAAGRAVVAADIGGLPEVVDDGQTGLLHAPGDAADLASKLAALLADDGRRAAMGLAGRVRYEKEFTVATMAAGLVEVFSRAIGSNLSFGRPGLRMP